MGHVIQIDFAARRNVATSESPAQPYDAAVAVTSDTVGEPGGTARRVPELKPVSAAVADSDRGAITGSKAAETEPRNLLEACARMRAETLALKKSIDDLTRSIHERALNFPLHMAFSTGRRIGT
ncbi:hypothetical protein CKO28_26550 [Rhodovibrio sodomensis]|uniref:Uncharacterized protein n=1 Tax=Rhodovibrio sodomensis TaxID=1088 RepID=A0ABS1DN80_9PROT|nr:hypothetical protein [Rhodovibrio sodomensis]MBK1671563.1 hypothetical protein [Rhodovibrio sodomensis]